MTIVTYNKEIISIYIHQAHMEILHYIPCKISSAAATGPRTDDVL